MTTPSSVQPLSKPDNFDTGPLTWVIGEIREALNRSKTALANAVSQEIDTRATSLRHAKTYLHQAHGALQMVDVDGVGIITETVEDMLERIESGQLALDDKLAATVGMSYQALTEYLDELLGGASNQPVRLFPYYKALLEARGAERIHPADLFFPNLAIRPQFPLNSEHIDASSYPVLRQRYEKALLPFLKGQDPQQEAEHASAMCGILAQVERMQATQQGRAFWWVMHGFAEAVSSGAVPNEVYIKQLFARINLQLRRLSEGLSSIPERLLRDALFFVARVEAPSALGQQIRTAYQLDNLVPADYEVKRYGQINFDALNQAKQYLGQAKNMWNRIAGGDSNPAQAFELEMKAMAEAGSMLNSPVLSKLTSELNRIARKAAYCEPGDRLGMEMATSLLFVENALNHINRLPENFAERADALTARLLAVIAGETPVESAQWLDDMSREAQQKQTMSVLSEELLSSLRQVEKSLEEYFADPEQTGRLEQIDQVMHQIEGALAVLDQTEALRAVGHTRNALRGFSEAGPTGPTDKAIYGKVAQNLGALSFFIETLQRDVEQATAGFAFDDADGTFHAYLLEKSAAPAPAERDADNALMPVIVTADDADPLWASEDASVDESAHPQQQSADPAHSRSAQPQDAAAQQQLNQSLEQMGLEAALPDDTYASQDTQGAIDLLQQTGSGMPDARAPETVAATTPVEETSPAVIAVNDYASDEAIDAELLEIFLSEADEVLACIRATLPPAGSSSLSQEPMTTLRRSFHTLKGSSRMVGLNSFGEAAWAVEQLLNVWLSGERLDGPGALGLVDEAASELDAWVADIRRDGRTDRTPERLIAAAARVKNGGLLNGAGSEESVPRKHPVSVDQMTGPGDANGAEGALSEEPVVEPPAGEIPAWALPIADDSDEALASPFFAPGLVTNDGELAEPAIEADPAFDAALVPPSPEEFSPDAQIAEAPQTSDARLTPDSTMESLPDELVPVEESAAPFGEISSPEPSSSRRPTADVLGFPMPTAAVGKDEDVKLIGDLEISVPLHNIYLAETDELVRLLSRDVEEWRHEPQRVVTILAVHAAHSLAGSSATVGFNSLHEVAHSLEMALQQLARQPVVLRPAEFDVLEDCITRLAGMLQTFALGEMPPHEPFLMDTVDRLFQDVVDRASGVPMTPHYMEAPDPLVPGSGSVQDLLQSAPLPQEAAEAAGVGTIAGLAGGPGIGLEHALQPHKTAQTIIDAVSVPGTPVDPLLEPRDDLDQDLLSIFIEEGSDILPQIGEALRGWREKPANHALPQALLRYMHTVKGSARMAGAMRLGQHIHEMESRVEAIMRNGPPSPQTIDDLLSRHDYGLYLFELLHNPGAVAPSLPAVGIAADSQPGMKPALPSTAGELSAQAGHAPSGAKVTAHAPESASSAVMQPASNVSPLVRVRVEMLDRLVNQAGEVSISRSKLETEVGTMQHSLGELTENVVRLRSQLRELEIQAETQIASNMTQSGDREFDPLEFDRFTRLQELTRMMAESVNDVASVQQNLARTVDGAAAGLNVQARLTRELQQDLMRVRMVQFASISERLYRVTRQTAKEMDKRVSLDIRGSSVEVDRAVLEKMAGPFEHLLRNAIVHGIESREQRRLNGKNETGELLIEIRQEGNEVVIRFTDDGQGLDIDRIRQKAVTVGLLENDSEISDAEAREMIFNPGFSTAMEVTELAGRGVGMDVVRSEAAALGGRVAVSSEPGKGAQFTINLPLTLAVTQVVLLSTGGRTYAVPSVLVEQVQQFKANPLAVAYNDGAVVWHGNRVPLHYLSSLLGDHSATPTAQQYSPIVILKSGGDRVAIHVDDIIGNREVVVKNIGPQLARMIGIAGATVLGSGDIVLILNPVPLALRHAQENRRSPQPVTAALQSMGAVAEMGKLPEPSSEPVAGLRTQSIVMVVDDSLTVRRVTQRLLAREGYQVVLAKDGVDALEQLQSITPDAMLVDIEMPRMDGFDLTRNVRGDERTRHVPIIMITSRTAIKHRTYAMELGVNEYLGKPYREEELLKLVGAFIRREIPVA